MAYFSTTHQTKSHYSILQNTTALHCIQQHSTSCYITLHHTTKYCSMPRHTTAQYIMLHNTTSYYRILQHAKAYNSTAHHATSHYSILQHSTSCYITLQQTMEYQACHGELQHTTDSTSCYITIQPTTKYQGMSWLTTSDYSVLRNARACYKKRRISSIQHTIHLAQHVMSPNSILRSTREYHGILQHITVRHIMPHNTTAYYEKLGHTMAYYSILQHNTSCDMLLQKITEY